MASNNGTLKRTKNSSGSIPDLQILSALSSRLALASQLGMSHKGERDLYETLGYPKEIESKDLISQWKRQDIARAIVDRPVKATWQGEVFPTEPNVDDVSELEIGYKNLDTKLKIKEKLTRVDRLAHLGKYAVMLLGFDDSRRDTWSQPVDATGERELKYIKVVSESNAEIKTWEKDPTNSRFGLPRLYKVHLTMPGEQGKTESLDVHYSRIVHVVLDQLEDEVHGSPVTEAAFNRLKDLEKLIGGSAEMFWRGARPGYAGRAKEDYQIDSDAEKKLMDQLEEYENDLRRFIVSEGVEIQSLAQQIADPKGHVDVQLMMLSALTGIPLRILVGSERGELASSSDQQNWKEWIQDRRDELAAPSILIPLVDRLIQYGALPAPENGTDGYAVSWSNLFTLDQKESSEIAAKLSEALAKYVKDPMLEQSVPFEAFLKYILNLDHDIADQIIEMRDAQLEEMIDEEDDLEIEAETEPEETDTDG